LGSYILGISSGRSSRRAEWFPDVEPPTRVFYRSRQEAEADLSDRAATFGRRPVGLRSTETTCPAAEP
jgi:hypothetical protein